MTRLGRLFASLIFNVPPAEVTEAMVDYLHQQPDLSMFKEKLENYSEEER